MDRIICEVNNVLVHGSDEGAGLRIQRAAPLGAQAYPTIDVHAAASLQEMANEEPPSSSDEVAGQETNRPTVARVEKYAAETLQEVQRIGRSHRFLEALLSWLSIHWPKHSLKVSSIAWHCHQQRLAVCDGADSVQLFDLAGTARTASDTANLESPQPSATLNHSDQTQVTATQFRPHHPGMLAVAGLGAVTLWDLHHPGQSSALSAFRLLRPKKQVLLVDLAWSPNGRLLAAAHGNTSGFTVWDAATGIPTTLSAGHLTTLDTQGNFFSFLCLASTSLLKWSPDGSYLLAALPGGSFQLWETCHWGNIAFQAGGGQLVSACWSPDSKTLLLAFSAARQLTALYLIGQAYSLKAQLLPVELPSFGLSSASAGNAISSMDWDVGGDRLAVGFGGDHPDAGKVGLYSTTCQPVVSAQLIGKISSGNSDKPVQAVKFHTKYSRGALLAILSCSKQISILPLLYKLA